MLDPEPVNLHPDPQPCTFCCRHKKKDIDVINDNDDAIAKLIADMRIAAKEDRQDTGLNFIMIIKTQIISRVVY